MSGPIILRRHGCHHVYRHGRQSPPLLHCCCSSKSRRGALQTVGTASISQTMEQLKQDRRAAFIPYICAGDPDLETTGRALQILDECGADVIELGVPYSDPLADGPVIHSAATRALEKHTTLDSVLGLLKRHGSKLRAPVLLFTYYNPILRRGLEQFCKQIKEAGAAGLLVPDIPWEETTDIRGACAAVGLELVLLTTPTTPQQRMASIARDSQGFVYLVSVTGVTGEKSEVSAKVQHLVRQLHELTNKSIGVGFGVSRPEHAQQIVSWGAEGVIVGTALVRALGHAPTPEQGLDDMKRLASSLRRAI